MSQTDKINATLNALDALRAELATWPQERQALIEQLETLQTQKDEQRQQWQQQQQHLNLTNQQLAQQLQPMRLEVKELKQKLLLHRQQWDQERQQLLQDKQQLEHDSQSFRSQLQRLQEDFAKLQRDQFMRKHRIHQAQMTKKRIQMEGLERYADECQQQLQPWQDRCKRAERELGELRHTQISQEALWRQCEALKIRVRDLEVSLQQSEYLNQQQADENGQQVRAQDILWAKLECAQAVAMETQQALEAQQFQQTQSAQREGKLAEQVALMQSQITRTHEQEQARQTQRERDLVDQVAQLQTQMKQANEELQLLRNQAKQDTLTSQAQQAEMDELRRRLVAVDLVKTSDTIVYNYNLNEGMQTPSIFPTDNSIDLELITGPVDFDYFLTNN